MQTFIRYLVNVTAGRPALGSILHITLSFLEMKNRLHFFIFIIEMPPPQTSLSSDNREMERERHFVESDDLDMYYLDWKPLFLSCMRDGLRDFFSCLEALTLNADGFLEASS